MKSNQKTKIKKITCLILDVDGVFTDGKFYYNIDGKFMKKFGAHDNDGIKMMRDKVKIQAISADHRGFSITKKRIQEDMKIPLELVSEENRLSWLREHYDLGSAVYMGDGLHDIAIFKNVAYSIAPNNAFPLVKKKAHYVTKTNAGEGAVLEACLHILKKFFNEKCV